MVEGVQVVERRSKPRVETKVRVRMVGREDEVETYAGNLSKSGVFLETKEPLAKVGEKIQMEILLSQATESIKVRGKVARIVAPNRMGSVSGIGIEFLRVEARQVRTFDRLIDRLLDARGIGSRKHPRLKTHVVVEFTSKEEVRKTFSENLSKGGLFLRTSPNGMALGDTLQVVILHPHSKRKFSAEAEVVHLRKGESTVSADFVEGVGVRFLLTSASQRTEMSGFLRSILSGKRV
ncbi:MAG TPA: PilZ domain-containing protein [Bdellovibrionota bacterium]|nr:PilZ domain-containing protein [Bdellovibrionota bacterium]